MFFNSIEESCKLVSGMAERLGRDFGAEIVANPDIKAATYRSAVLRCSACGFHGECERLQADNDRLDAAPSYCLNVWD